jgi:hypothetical protein
MRRDPTRWVPVLPQPTNAERCAEVAFNELPGLPDFAMAKKSIAANSEETRALRRWIAETVEAQVAPMLGGNTNVR